DPGEIEALRGINPSAPGPTPAGSLRGWEVPPATDVARDPWLAPGQAEAIASGDRLLNIRAPLSCRLCAASLSVSDAWAFDGDIYCSACRPPGAVSGHQLPRDLHPGDEPLAYDSRNGWGFRLLRSIIDLVTGDS
ncbi:MAG TPA: hypothetical protein VKE49_08895, partial [Myxococcaceae bacterium]|nr:hypothetical protein [Myxococcaceae bacterium]